jgi:hypothetical protein
VKWDYPSISVEDPTNYLINGSFAIVQRYPNLVWNTIADGGYGPDRWKFYRQTADVTFYRSPNEDDSNILSPYYLNVRKTTNAGKWAMFQVVEKANCYALRGKTMTFQFKATGASWNSKHQAQPIHRLL